jgi:hypothetical protein
MFFLGLDLGQKRDHTAVVVVERVENRRAFAGTVFEGIVVRYAERLALGTPYPAVVARVREIVRSDDLCPLSDQRRGRCTLTVDATGVGAPVVDMLNAAQPGRPRAVVISGGLRASGDVVPKQDLMAELLVLLENGQLTIGNLREGARLQKELMEVRTRVSASGRPRVGADGSGEHDDLVMALACWSAKGREYVRKERDDCFEGDVIRLRITLRWNHVRPH